jgi:hypothetical protein
MTDSERIGLIEVLERGRQLFIGHPQTMGPVELSMTVKEEVLRALRALRPLDRNANGGRMP